VYQDIPTVLVGMPEALFRMQLARMVTLEELERIFNQVLNTAQRRKVSDRRQLQLIANELFPELFVQPKDEYMARMMHDVAKSFAGNPERTVLSFLGNCHVSPVSRLWLR
jgi:hypothetical protein